MNTYDFVKEFSEALEEQLKSDAKRYGNTWLQRFPDGQEARIWERLQTYFDQYKNADVAIPWLKIAGLALIAWVRDNHPELFEQDSL